MQEMTLTSLNEMIDEAWKGVPIPTSIVNEPKDFEAYDVEGWLLNKHYSEIASDNKFNSYLPFLFLNPEAICYVSRAYVQWILNELMLGRVKDIGGSIPFIHFLSWLSSPSLFGTSLEAFTSDQLRVLSELLGMLEKLKIGGDLILPAVLNVNNALSKE